MRPLVLIILVNYNKPDDTVDCLRSLSAANYENFRVLVVDNSPTEQAAAAIRSAHPHVEVVSAQENLGFAGGNNLGIARASGVKPRYFLFLNNDTLVDPGFLDPLVEVMESDERIGAVGGTICYYPETERLWYAGGKVVEWRALALHRHYRQPAVRVHGAVPSDVSFITGCLLMVRAGVVEELGPFDERYFMYFEDAEFSMRLRRNGYRLVYVPQSRVFHKIEHAGDTPTTAYYGLRSRLAFVQRCLSGWRRVLAYCYISVTQSIRLLQSGFTRRDLFRARLAAIRDHRRGVTGVMTELSIEPR